MANLTGRLILFFHRRREHIWRTALHRGRFFPASDCIPAAMHIDPLANRELQRP